MKIVDCDNIAKRFIKDPAAKRQLKSILTMILYDLKTNMAKYTKFRYYAVEHAVFVLGYEFLTAAEIEKMFNDSDYFALLADEQKGDI